MKASLALALLCGVSLSGSVPAQTSLRLKLTPGKTHVYAMEVNVGQGITAPVSQTMDLVLKVLKKSGDIFTLEASLANVKNKPPKGSPAGAEQPKVAPSTKYMATYNSRGSQLSFKPVKAGDSGQFGSLMGTMNFGFMGLEFPANPVRVGTTWTVKHDITKIVSKALGPVAAQVKIAGSPLMVKYRVKSIAGKTVTITSTYEGNLDMTIPGQQGKTQPMKMTIGGTGMSVVEAGTGIQRNGRMDIVYSITTPMKTKQTMSMSFRLK